MVLKRKKNRKDAQQQPPQEPVPVPEEEEPVEELGEMVKFTFRGVEYEVPPQAAVVGLDRTLRYANQMARIRRCLHYEEPRDSLMIR